MPQIYRDNLAALSVLLDEAGSSRDATLLIPDLHLLGHPQFIQDVAGGSAQRGHRKAQFS